MGFGETYNENASKMPQNASKLMRNGEQNHKLNFPDDDTEVYPGERVTSSQYFGVTYNLRASRWQAQRYSKPGNKVVYNGSYRKEETAAHASDTLARTLMRNGEEYHMLNFPDDYTEVYPERQTSSMYLGVAYNKWNSKWCAYRHSKAGKKLVYHGSYNDEETAAHASDTL